MSRVGRKRLGIGARQETIVRAVVAISFEREERATRYKIARYLGLTPSTHLKGILDGMVASGMIGVWRYENGRRQQVDHWSMIATVQTGCELPWKCDRLCVLNEGNTVCIGSAMADKHGYLPF